MVMMLIVMVIVMVMLMASVMVMVILGIKSIVKILNIAGKCLT